MLCQDYLGRTVHSFPSGGQTFTVDVRYMPVKTVGSGAYGIVCAAVDKVRKRKVAIKKIPKTFDDLVDAKRILREVKMLMHFKHPNLCDLHDIVPPQTPERFSDVYLVLGFMESDLHKIIYSQNNLTHQHFQYFLYQILKGLKHLHSAGIIHRDLKPSNILVNANCDLKICDFGLARSVKDTHSGFTQYVVTRWYRPPEIMCCQDYYDVRIDVWSVGCIFAEMLKRKPLFNGNHYIQQLNLIFQTLGTPCTADISWIKNRKAYSFIQSRPYIPQQDLRKLFPTATPQAISLLSQMLKFNPNSRISVEGSMNHPYLATFHDANCDDHLPLPPLFDHTYESMQNLTVDRIKQLLYEAMLEIQRTP